MSGYLFELTGSHRCVREYGVLSKFTKIREVLVLLGNKNLCNANLLATKEETLTKMTPYPLKHSV